MDQKFLDLAKDELGEDATKREQSLALFRSWLKSHSFLSGVREDDVFLLRFLRANKFSMDASFKIFERTFLSIKKYPQFCDMNLDVIDALFDTGLVCPLIGRDQYGRKIILVRFAMIDTNIFKSEDIIKALCGCSMILLEEEETQITGISFIFDMEGASKNHFCSPSSLIDLSNLSKEIRIAREKKFIFINLNGFAQVALEFITPLLKKKLRDRIVVLKSCEILKDYVDVTLLPKEYGGTVPVAEMLKEFLKFKEEKRDLLKKSFINHGVDWSKVSPEMLEYQNNSETIGSFRKLEID